MTPHFYIKIDYLETRINVGDVQFIQSERDKIHIKFVDGTCFVKVMPLHRFVKKYGKYFLRVQRSYAINAEKVYRISSKEIILNPGTVKIPVGKSYLKNLKQILDTKHQ